MATEATAAATMKTVAPEVHLPPATTAMAEVATLAMEKEDIHRHLDLAMTSMEKAAMEDRLLDTHRQAAILATLLQEDILRPVDIHHKEDIHHQDMEEEAEEEEEEGIRHQVMAEALLVDMTDMAKVVLLQAMVMATAGAAPLLAVLATIMAMEREAMTTGTRGMALQ